MACLSHLVIHQKRLRRVCGGLGFLKDTRDRERSGGHADTGFVQWSQQLYAEFMYSGTVLILRAGKMH